MNRKKPHEIARERDREKNKKTDRQPSMCTFIFHSYITLYRKKFSPNAIQTAIATATDSKY